MTTSPDRGWITSPRLLGLAAVGAFLFSYWHTLVELCEFWQRDEDYSAGAFVPLVAAYVIWSKRKQLRALTMRVCWWGFAALACAQAVRFCGMYLDYISLERYSIVLTVLSLVLIVFGPGVLWRLRWVSLFLFLMLPLPYRIHTAVTVPLQEFASVTASFWLELMGYWVVRHGNILELDGRTLIAVEEACNGLRMLTAFIFVSATLAFVIHRPTWQKATLVLSSVPIAICGNAVRLVATATYLHWAAVGLSETLFHDLAGLAMMPLAVLILLGELRLLRWLSTDVPIDKLSSDRGDDASVQTRAGTSPQTSVAEPGRLMNASRRT